MVSGFFISSGNVFVGEALNPYNVLFQRYDYFSKGWNFCLCNTKNTYEAQRRRISRYCPALVLKRPELTRHSLHCWDVTHEDLHLITVTQTGVILRTLHICIIQYT